MEIPVIQSSLLASKPPCGGLPSCVDRKDTELIAKVRKDDRKYGAKKFRRQYFYGRGFDKKTCIWPGGGYSWLDDSSGITWVGVFGKDSICIVTKAGDVDVTRVHGWLMFLTIEEFLCNFRCSVISEIEDIGDPSCELHKMLSQSIKKPFGVVSVEGGHHEPSSGEYEEDRMFKLYMEELNKEDPGDDCESDKRESCDEEKSSDDRSGIKLLVKRLVKNLRAEWAASGYDEKKSIKYLQENMKKEADVTIDERVQDTSDKYNDYNEKKAIKFLEEQMKTSQDFSLKDTIQIAITAFQHLVNKELNVDDIGVTFMDPKDPNYTNGYFKEVDKCDIKDHLAKLKKRSEKLSSRLCKRSVSRRVSRRLRLAKHLGLQTKSLMASKVLWMDVWSSTSRRL